MKKSVFAGFLMFVLFIAGCAVQETPEEPPVTEDPLDKTSCEVDTDCICDGIDADTGNCFLGNKEYYAEHVDKKSQCADFCSGIAGNLVVRCVNNECTQTFECLADAECGEGESCKTNRCVSDKPKDVECTKNSDCIRGGCSGTICQSAKKPPILTTCEFLPEYSCYQDISCGCVDNKCAWQETPSFKECVDTARASQ